MATGLDQDVKTSLAKVGKIGFYAASFLKTSGALYPFGQLPPLLDIYKAYVSFERTARQTKSKNLATTLDESTLNGHFKYCISSFTWLVRFPYLGKIHLSRNPALGTNAKRIRIAAIRPNHDLSHAVINTIWVLYVGVVLLAVAASMKLDYQQFLRYKLFF